MSWVRGGSVQKLNVLDRDGQESWTGRNGDDDGSKTQGDQNLFFFNSIFSYV